ncbi:MAG: rRNA maturation RNase YbeY, partial [Clostridia bacterium]|nr:rRNA maturation RNase YbeY [Clostridia bacterium]
MIVRIENEFPTQEATRDLIQRACEAALAAEGVHTNTSVEIILTDDERIHALNQKNRGVDKATDVLSFPTCPFHPGKTAGAFPSLLRRAYDPDDGACFLGSIVISVPHARAQAAEYGHSVEREIAYLTTHAMFHLMGYDHMNEEDKLVMRSKEEEALKATVLSQEDEWMLEQARKAM